MLYNYFTEKLLNLQGVLIKNIEKINWQTGILNTFEYPYSNGFTEGCNNQIKVLKRTGYGYRNSNQFRKRNTTYIFLPKPK